MQLRYMVTSKRGGFEPVRRDENDNRISMSERKVNPQDFKGSVTFGLLDEAGQAAEWDELEINITDLNIWSSFKHGEIRTITIGDPE